MNDKKPTLAEVKYALHIVHAVGTGHVSWIGQDVLLLERLGAVKTRPTGINMRGREFWVEFTDKGRAWRNMFKRAGVSLV